MSAASLFLVLVWCGACCAYRPVVLMHGVFSTNESISDLASAINRSHPGTRLLSVDVFDNLASLENMWKQVDGVYAKIQAFMDDASEGVNMVCYSQGGLICRGILEKFSHNVHTFVSLATPLAGQFGMTEYMKKYLANTTRDMVYKVAYTTIGQDLSFSNYWKDPNHQDLYYQYCNFLPALDNATNAMYRENFVKLQQLVLIGGPDDGVVTPWQSSHFAFYDQNLLVQPMKSQQFYLDDSFGLKALSAGGRVKVYEIPGVEHHYWHVNQTVFDCCIEPWLD